MPQLINLFLVIFGVIGVGVGLVGWRHGPMVALLPLVIGGALVALAYASDRRRERRKDERERAAIRQGVADLTQRARQPGESLKVYGAGRYIFLALLVTVIGAGILDMGITASKLDAMPFIGGFVFLSGLLWLSRALPGLGHPVIELASTGFTTPLNGRIAWCHVSGIFLHTVTGRGGTKNYWIKFRVKQFARVAARVHWTDRLLGVFRLGALAKGVVSVGLPGTKPPPEAVYAAARQWWKQATRHDYEWNPLMSDEHNEALKRLAEFSQKMSEESLTDPLQVSLHMDQISRDTQLFQREQKRLLSRSRYSLVIMMAVMLLLMAWPWVRAWLHS